MCYKIFNKGVSAIRETLPTEEEARRLKFSIGLVVCILILCFTSSLSASRMTVSLDGQWEFVKVSSLDEPPPSSGWQKMDIPGTLYGTNYERVWFRRTINIPKEWQNSRIILSFAGVKYNSRVLVNNRNVGGCFNGYDAFEIDVTDAVHFGGQNEILVGCHDWTGVFVGEKVDFTSSRARGRLELREVPRDRIISPIGGVFFRYGIWDSAYLLSIPQIYIKEVLIQPSICQNQVKVGVKIQNAGSKTERITLKGDIYRWDGQGRDKEGQWGIKENVITSQSSGRVEIPAGEEREISLIYEKPPLETWSPYTPVLYVLELRSEPGGDILRERFGYRELWTQDGDFYLNGKKIHFLASSWWPPTQGASREYALNQLIPLKKMNAVAFRTHTQPWQDIYYEVADEIGLMMIPEGAVWNDDGSYRVFDPKFWENYAQHLRSMVHHLYNHPSIVMWSLENEFYGSRVNERNPETEENLARMGKIVKAEDPTRPITYESDGDPGGVADVIGMHYPNEFPEKRLWPNDAYWLKEPRLSGGGGMFWHGPFLWDHKKPLYIGEYLWAPMPSPAYSSLFFGDEAYRDLATYRTKSKALAWRMQSLAYRYYDVSGHSPWTVIEQGPLDETNPCWVVQRDMYRPLAGFLKEYDSRFYSGEKIERTVWIFNDTMKDLSQVKFIWALLYEDKVIEQGGETLSMRSGTMIEKKINLSLPKVESRRRLKLRLSLDAEAVPSFKEEWGIEIFPPLTRAIFPSASIWLYDPKGILSPILHKMNGRFNPLENLADWNGDGILIIAPQSLAPVQKEGRLVIGMEGSGKSLLSNMVEKGGKILILEQSPSANDWLPVSLDNQSSTFAFPQISVHPILKDINAEDLRWWRGDNIVSENEPIRPMQAGTLSLVVTGAGDGLSHAPLVEIRQGKGIWLICQLKVASKLKNEPMAGLLLERMLDYLAKYVPPQGETLVYVPSSLEEKLKELRLAYRPLKNWDELHYPAVNLLIIQESGRKIEEKVSRIKEFLQAGGKVLWHRPELEDIATIKELTNQNITIQPYRGPIVRKEEVKGDILPYLTREDLYWLGPTTGVWWETAPLATDSTEAIFAPEITVGNTKRYPATKDCSLTGQVSAQGDELGFWSNGKVEWEIDFPETGNYDFGLVARGTHCKGVYPLVEVYLDGERAGILYVGSEARKTYSCSFQAKKGKHKLAIAFINDAYAPPEDRNLWVESFLIAKGEKRENLEELTSPSALLYIPIGKGTLILNSLKWDEPPAGNGLKAKRFMGNLFSALGTTSLPAGQITVLKAEILKPLKEYPLLHVGKGFIELASNATLESDIEIAKEGDYRITIVARGTALGGIYPIVRLEIDGKEIGEVECKGGEDWSPHSIVAHLPTGRHNFRLSFINDEYKPPEDRNLWISRVEFEGF